MSDKESGKGPQMNTDETQIRLSADYADCRRFSERKFICEICGPSVFICVHLCSSVAKTPRASPLLLQLPMHELRREFPTEWTRPTCRQIPPQPFQTPRIVPPRAQNRRRDRVRVGLDPLPRLRQLLFSPRERQRPRITIAPRRRRRFARCRTRPAVASKRSWWTTVQPTRRSISRVASRKPIRAFW